MLSAIRLPLVLDCQGLQSDLASFSSCDWVPHFNTSYYKGEWSGVALRSVGGVARQLYPDPNPTEPWRDTDNLDRCPHIRSLLDKLYCPLQSVRFLKLAAGASIREHRDHALSVEDGELRIHVPVRTNPQVEFFLDGRRVDMREGEAWYLDLNLKHRVANLGTTDRVHLVIDCEVNDWLLELLRGPAA